MLERWKVDHKQSFNGNLKLATRSKFKELWFICTNIHQNAIHLRTNRIDTIFGFYLYSYLMCRIDITKSSLMNCSNSVDEAKKEDAINFNLSEINFRRDIRNYNIFNIRLILATDVDFERY